MLSMPAPSSATARWRVGGAHTRLRRERSAPCRRPTGLASAGGGEAWFDAPASVTCEDPTFTATLWVSNASPDTLSGISATLTLPQGLSLAAGQSMTQSISDLSPQQARSASWVVVADTQAQAQALAYSVTVTFAGGVDPVTTGGTISVPACQPAATATPTMPFTSPTETPAVGPTATPAPEVPEPGSLALLFTGPGRSGWLLWLAAPPVALVSRGGCLRSGAHALTGMGGMCTTR